jgi:hypothetical protein
MTAESSNSKKLVLLLPLFSIFVSPFGAALAQGTAFTYQGRLNDAGLPANGLYDFSFSVFDSASNSVTRIAGPLTNATTPVASGLFTVGLDFGQGIFTGAERWLEIGVRTNGAAAAFFILSPRQQLTASPYAITAASVNGVQIQQNVSGAPNFIAGASGNFIPPGTAGAVIGGGGATNYFDGVAYKTYSNNIAADFSVVGGGRQNSIGSGAIDATISGGGQNAILSSAAHATIAGGSGNQASAVDSTVSGGSVNSVVGNASGANIGGGNYNQIGSGAFNGVIAGGYNNSIQPSAYYSAIGGGQLNSAAAPFATIPGGLHNLAYGASSFAAGNNAQATNDGAFVWADNLGQPFTSTRSNQFLVRASGGVGIGTNNPQTALHVNGTITANNYIGSGAGLTAVNGSALAPGSVVNSVIADGTLSGTKIAGGQVVKSLNGLSDNVTLTAGLNVSLVPSGNSIQIASTGGLGWQSATGTVQQAQANTAYILTNSGLTTVTLPVSPPVGSIFGVVGIGSGGWQIAQNPGQSILTGNSIDSSDNWVGRASTQNWASVVSSMDGTKLIAAAGNSQGVFASTDSGATWTQHSNGLTFATLAASGDCSKLAAASYADQLYTSSDLGATWTTAQPIKQHWSAVAVSSNGATAACVSGGAIYTGIAAGFAGSPQGVFNSWTCVGSSSDGVNLVAAGLGLLYVSHDSGSTWATPSDLTTQLWVSVASSANGQTMLAAVSGGPLFISSTSGGSWTQTPTVPALLTNWSSVAVSADGMKLFASVSGGQIFKRVIPSQTWVPHGPVRNWRAICSSSDGSRLAAAENGGQIYTSSDGGTNWAATGPVESWTSIACSANGTNLAATVSGGQVYISLDFGSSWTPRATARNWSSIGMAGAGSILTAAVDGDQLYTSYDSGSNWVADSGRLWTAMACSVDGTKLAAAANNDFVYISNDSGSNWNATAFVGSWSSLASSSDGSVLLGTMSGGPTNLYLSRDSGSTWNPTASLQNWSCVASSSNGTNLFAAAQGAQIYSSSDSGTTWIPYGPTKNWTAIATSADGSRLAAVVYADQVYLSSNSGVTWVPHAAPQNWSCVASSSDGTKLVAGTSPGQIFTASTGPGSSTTQGTLGGLSGIQNSSVQLLYIGNNQFVLLSSTPTIVVH